VPGFGEEVAVIGPPGFGADAELALVALEDRYTKKVIDYAEKILDRYDRNKNGQLEAEEIKNGRWSSPPEESDLNNDGILSKGELAERIAKKYGGRKDDDDRDNDDDDDRRGSSSSRGDSSGGDSDRYRRYAEALVKQNDKNNNGVLEKEEWKSVKVAYGADASKDGVVTAAELTAKLSGYGDKNDDKESSSSSSSSRDSGDSRSRYSRSSRDRRDRDDDDDDKSSTIRFLTATERLPRGLSDWFLKADQEGNNDGQVHLSEYKGSSKEFREYDLNNDGFVTPAECLEAAERKAR
jgi:Ca2+-binding EF-hand superfamily protein